MSVVNYPEAFPVESVAEVVKVIRKQVEVDKASLARHAWNVQGYLQKVVLGEPDAEAIVAGPLNITADSLAAGLESLNPEAPQQILAGGLTKKLMLFAITKLIERLLAGADLPDSIEHLIESLLPGLLGA